MLYTTFKPCVLLNRDASNLEYKPSKITYPVQIGKQLSKLWVIVQNKTKSVISVTAN